MKVQSLSIHVPNNHCINNCKFCVSQMRNNKYANLIQGSDQDYYEQEYLNRLNFARDNNCNTLMLTGTSEPQQNKSFIKSLMLMNNKLDKPFRNMELQTTGVLLDLSYLNFFKYETCVKTISLSISNPFNDQDNALISGMPKRAPVALKSLSKMIKEMGFNLRLSLNLTDVYNDLDNETKIKEMFTYFKEEYGANQLTFRKFYLSDNNCIQNDWIKEHHAHETVIKLIEAYIIKHGRPLEKLEYGAIRYSLDEMSIVVDSDCMASSVNEIRYLILRPNCHLYTKWDDDGSLLY